MPMSMSYVVMENSYRQLREAEERLNDEFSSDREEKYRTKLIELCQRIAEEYGNPALPAQAITPEAYILELSQEPKWVYYSVWKREAAWLVLAHRSKEDAQQAIRQPQLQGYLHEYSCFVNCENKLVKIEW